MSDSLARLSAALADRYVIERELGAGGMATASGLTAEGGVTAIALSGPAGVLPRPADTPDLPFG
jgi:hypothetical protein